MFNLAITNTEQPQKIRRDSTPLRLLKTEPEIAEVREGRGRYRFIYRIPQIILFGWQRRQGTAEEGFRERGEEVHKGEKNGQVGKKKSKLETSSLVSTRAA